MDTLNHLELDNLFIPAKIPSKKLMIVLHGRGDSSEGFVNLPRFLKKDDLNYLMLDAPFEYFTGYSWYQLPPNQLPGILHSREMLTKVCDALFEEDFNIEESFLFGFSQGSLLTFEFGARYDKVFKGYIALSGYIYDDEKLRMEMNEDVMDSRWLCTHGVYDNVLPFDTSLNQIEFLQESGFDIEFKKLEKDHSITEEELDMISAWMDKE